MSITSEEEVDEDGVRLPDRDSHRSHVRHDSSGSSNIHLDDDRDHSLNEHLAERDEDQDEDEEDYSSASVTDSDGDSDSDEDNPRPAQPPFSQHTFAPPFYGRPPTPLPPSPSLTSLLRPSRPTTPDASDDDGHGGTGTGTGAGGGSGGSHPRDPVPRARPKVPTYEYYGFVLYLFSSLSFLIYLLWSYLPSPFLHALGIYYYPNRWWSLAIPSFLVMLLVYIYVALAGYNLEILTLPLESVETIADEAAMVAVVDSRGRIVRGEKKSGRGRRRRGTVTTRTAGTAAAAKEKDGEGLGKGLDWREVWNEGTDAVMDVPLAGVCEVLYGEGREWDSEVEGGEGGITRL